ncbi:GNAT family N-acetyltransferase [Mangrovibacterium lignilyticum]|uniref:GNAT family N-acetyltransferase n=1 Tax=Mangrovibacterium lignilyticum TaxID=2668052 RepID=UPI0013D55771|nr:GNAT family N-acetyltransferase [Mangrovibacterium lignilyticum]
MQIIQVDDKKSVNAFHELPYTIYKNDPNWVPPLRIMVENTFNPGKNNSLKHGDAQRWLVEKDGHVVGRISAFVTDTYAYSFEQPTGGIGFFECIDDQDAANLLFDTAISWLKSKNMEAVDGPINIGENFFNWGVLVDGFMQQTFGMQYNLPYYAKLFNAYGFQTYYEQYSYHLNITSPDLPERFWKIAAWMAKKPGYTYAQFRFAQKEKFIADFIAIYEQAWVKHDNYKRIDPEDINKMLEESKMMLEEDFIWFVYHDGKPIAFFMMVPDLNQLFKRIRSGKVNLYNLMKMLWLRRRKVITGCRVLVMGVIPKFQKSGIESAIFYQLRQVLVKKPWYTDMEMSWVGDFNPKMIAIFKAVGGEHEKTHKTLRYLFDRNKEFKRAPIIED